MQQQIAFFLSFPILFVFSLPVYTQSAYVPGPEHQAPWEKRSPEQVKMDPAKLQAAIQFAIENENPANRNLEVNHYQTFGLEPFGDGIGPFKERGAPTGVILRNGYIVAEWGDPFRVDMTFSVAKSFLSTVVGLAYDRGLIRNIDDLAGPYMAPVFPLLDPSGQKAENLGKIQPLDLFGTEHNRKITWNHLLRQVSDWEGTLWGKPDWADRPSGEASSWMTRPRNAPGTVYEYNDTRVNVLALAALNVWRKPLPQVLREYVMDPIGASPTWRWMGYENSWVILDGQPVQSVSGGSHWGGGLFISARDQARFGLLTLRRGKWADRQILSENWIKMALTPTPVKKDYGFMNWFLNTDQEYLPSAPESAFVHVGAGNNIIYVDPVNDLVVVARWIKGNAVDGLVKRVLESLHQ